MKDVEVVLLGRTDRNETRHDLYFASALSLTKRTNADGQVDLPYFQSENKAVVMLCVPGGDWQQREFSVPSTGVMATIRLPSKSLAFAKDSAQ